MNTDIFKKLDWMKILPVFLILVYLSIVMRNGWLCDDAYISLRTVDNFVNGFGLTWNISERVQAFTHPLWVFLIIPFYAITGEVYFTVITLSIILSMAAVAWYVFKIARTFLIACLGLIALPLSTAFVDFSTSGLENPLTYLLLALFLYFYFHKEHNLRTLKILCLIAALGAVNRLDTILLFLPMIVHVFWINRSGDAIRSAIICFLPLIVWETFSLIYYGFPFPNTAYAKLTTGIARPDLWQHGLWYILYSLHFDPITVVMIAFGIIVPIFARGKRTMAPAIAIFLYLLYIINIGGCFMAGRYLAAPMFMAVLLLSQYRNIPKHAYYTWLLVILILGSRSIDSPMRADTADKGEPSKIRHGIVRERDWYNPTHGLMNYDSDADQWPSHDWITEGQQARISAPTYLPHVAVGMVGFFAGPESFILDVYAITDPLLARLPVNKNIDVRIGHYGRFVPAGYKQSILTGENHIRDQYLSRYYEKLTLLTQGDIFDMTRFSEIFKFNFGSYNHLLEQYLAPHMKRVNIEDVNQPGTEGIIGFYTDNIVYYPQGLEINLDHVSHAPKFEIGRDTYIGQRFDFMLTGRKVASGLISSIPGRPRELTTAIVSVPPGAVESGFDKIVIYPENPALEFHTFRHLRLID